MQTEILSIDNPLPAERGQIFVSLWGQFIMSPDTVVAVMEELSGDPEVLYQLGIQYATGDGVKEDTKKGVELLCQAAEQGHQKAKDALKLFE